MEEKPLVSEKNVLLEWESPSRPFKPRSREFYKTAGALALLVVIILFFIGEFLLIGAILATLFAVYALSTVPPTQIQHRITNLGVETGETFHRWEELQEFWFDEKYGQKMVVIRLLASFPPFVQLLLGNVSQDKIKALLTEEIPMRQKPVRTFLDKGAAWLAKNIPLERSS